MPDPVTSERLPRSDLDIDPRAGSIAAGGATVSFTPDDPDALLESYLRLVRRLRDQQRADEVSLRRDEVERLAAHLGTSGESVLERLGTLMGATKAQRRVMAGLFLAGAMVITVAVPSVAALSGGSGDEVPATPASTTLGAVTNDSIPGAPTLEPVAEPRRAEPEQRETGGATLRATIDVRNGPDGPGNISADQLVAADPIDQPRAEAEPLADETLPEPEPSIDADQPAPPSAPPEPSPVAPAEPTVPHEAVEVAVGPPPEPDAPSMVVDPTPPPRPPPPPPPPPAPEPTPVDEALDVDGDTVVAVGPPPIPPADPPIVDPPGD